MNYVRQYQTIIFIEIIQFTFLPESINVRIIFVNHVRSYIIQTFYLTCYVAILDSLQEVKQVPGIVTGKQSGNSIYIPIIYSKSQNEWVENFYKQNGYLGKVYDL